MAWFCSGNHDLDSRSVSSKRNNSGCVCYNTICALYLRLAETKIMACRSHPRSHATHIVCINLQDVEKYNWCVVPDSGSDAVLFISTALLASCICSGQLSALYILLLGEGALVAGLSSHVAHHKRSV